MKRRLNKKERVAKYNRDFDIMTSNLVKYLIFLATGLILSDIMLVII